jgi:hypothetical protein
MKQSLLPGSEQPEGANMRSDMSLELAEQRNTSLQSANGFVSGVEARKG